MRKIFFVILACVAFCTAQAQRFEWVRTYTGPDINDDPTNKIVGSCVDSAGNLYILGEFSPQAKLCGVDLLPHEIITTPLRNAIVIAKLSSQGDLVWHKAIYSSAYNWSYGLCQMGDTAFMVMVQFRMDHNFNNFLYYLDTLLTSADAGYLQSADSTYSFLTDAFITFDLDGNVIEQHFLELGYVDSSGHTVTWRDRSPSTESNAMASTQLQATHFSVDRDGNIYICRNTPDFIPAFCDTCPDSQGNFHLLSVEDGTIEALRIMVDGTRPILYYPTQQSATWNRQIMKFSPHFDSLVAIVYVFDTTEEVVGNVNIITRSFDVDLDGNVYIGLGGNTLPSILRINNSDSIQINTQLDIAPTWIVKYNPFLQATGLILFSSYLCDFPVTVKIAYPYIDEQTNSLYFSGTSKWPLSNSSTIRVLYQRDTIEIPNRMGFWLRLNKEDLGLQCWWIAQPVNQGEMLPPVLSAHNNRVFAQTFFYNGISFGDTVINIPMNNDQDLAFMVWNNEGHELLINNRGVSNHYNIANAPIIIDSSVYLTGSLFNDATFDTITTQSWGHSYAYIAKYVDPEFMVPYLPESERLAQSIEWDQELQLSLADSTVALTATSTSGLPVKYACSDTNIARVVGSTLYLLSEGEASVTASQPGNSMYQPADPVTKLLHVSSTGIAQGERPVLAVYPNPARDAVYCYYAGERVRQVTVVTSTGVVADVPIAGGKVDISTLPNGVYYMTFVTESNIYQHKIIKL